MNKMFELLKTKGSIKVEDLKDEETSEESEGES